MNNLAVFIAIPIVVLSIRMIRNDFFKWRARVELKKVINNS